MSQFLLSAFLLAVSAPASPPPAVLTAPDPVAFDFFGSALAVSGDIMVTGYPARQPALKGRVFSASIAGPAPVIEASFATDIHGDGLGLALDIDEDLIVIGAPWSRPSQNSFALLAGRVHLLARAPDGTVTEVASVSSTSAGSLLGAAVGIADGWVVAGVPGHKPPWAPPGAPWGEVRFFATDGTTLTPGSALTMPAELPVRNLGQSAAISGSWAAASANLFEGPTPAAGVVALMHRQKDDTWELVETLMAPAPIAGDRFGLALALEGDLLAAGAPAPGQLADEARGALFLYRFDGGSWKFEAMLESPSEQFCEGFGRSVAIGDGIIAVGALATESAAADAAAVFTFRQVRTEAGSQWVADRVRTGFASEDFGAALAWAGERLLIAVPGAPGEAGSAQGEVLVVGFPFADLTGDGVIDGSDLAIVLGAWGHAAPGDSADLNGDGVVNGIDLAFILSNWSRS